MTEIVSDKLDQQTGLAPELLAAIKARAAAATPGPWSWRGYNDEDPRLQGARTRIVMSVIRRERQADDPETKSYEDYVHDWEMPYVDADGKAGYRRLNDEEVAEHVTKDWLQDPWGGPQYDNRLAFRNHGSNIMEYARDIPVREHPDAVFIEHARTDVDALLAEVARLTALVDRAAAAEEADPHAYSRDLQAIGELRMAARRIREGATIDPAHVAVWLECVAIDEGTEHESGPRAKERFNALQLARAVLSKAEETADA